jgi:Zn-dependent peptidase ImmA (M78 family)
MPERKFIEKFKEYKNNEQKDKKEIMTSLANFFFVPIENVKARAYNIGLIGNLFV